MKKFLLSIAAVMLAVFSVQADEATFDSSVQNYSNAAEISSATIVDGKITATFDKGTNSNTPKYYTSGTAIRVYGGGFFTVEGNNVTITKIVLTFGASDGSNAITTDCGTFTQDTWTGSASSVKFTVDGTKGNRRIKAITVTYTENAGTPTVATPKFSVKEGAFEGSLDVEITAEEGATIYYTLNGEDPTTESTKYEGAINITATTTVKAFAVKADCNDSRIAEATYTKLEKKNIEDIIAAGAGEAWAEGTVVATYAQGFLMSDETGYILVYQGNSPAVTVVEGDVVTVKGATSEYGGLMQFGYSATVEKTGTAEVNHPEATVLDGAALDAFVDDLKVQYVEYTGTLNISNNKYYNVEVEGATAQGSIQYPNDGFITVESGTEVKVTGYIIGVSSGKYVNTMAVKVEKVVPTAIEGVETEAAEQVIYDLTGRRVETITEDGIYIVNGKKVFVK